MKFKTYIDFIKESIDWTDDLITSQEMEIADAAENTLLTKDLCIIGEDDDSYSKLEQLASANSSEIVLEITGHTLISYTVPLEFLKWERLGTNDVVYETCFIAKMNDLSKI